MKKVFAEFIGTFTLVLFACGTASVLYCATNSPDGAYFMTALSFGLVIVAMAYSIGQISGCHINPAVSLAVLLNGKMTVLDFISYVVAQFAGAITGAAVLSLLIGNRENLGQNGLYQGSIGTSFAVEVVLTFIFVMVILFVTSKKEYEKPAGLIIGMTLTLVHIFGIHFTGTSVNPARSFGPAMLVGGEALKNVWVFILAPLVGAVLAAIVFKLLTNEGKQDKLFFLKKEETEEASDNSTVDETNEEVVEEIIDEAIG
ncbi:MAG: aquaporin [Ruminococcaceae bacterium]|nr:aquaporin [Oscillospiraceae bacterium]